mmetsp:Transcript_26425/g.78157  ORF Transcript_26425/g.78157 Transcript_26425/m.78157 type:complete len:565 (-) Transcript_26425:637-2331(-)
MSRTEEVPLDTLPDEGVELFFSVVVRDGSDTEDNIAHERSAKLARSRHLQWALHRGASHGCQPAMFWRTPLVRTDEPEDHMIQKFLSQAANDFVLGQVSPDEKQAILVYIIDDKGLERTSPGETTSQFSLIRNIWEAAAAKQEGSRVAAIGVKCIRMQPCDFSEKVITVPHSEAVVQSPSADSTDCHVPVDQLAALRGAGLLMGYPAAVFDCNLSSSSFTCADINGKVIGHCKGDGILAHLETTFEEGKEPLDTFVKVEGRLNQILKTCEAVHDDGSDSCIFRAMEEISCNGKLVISRWLCDTHIPNINVGGASFSSSLQSNSNKISIAQQDKKPGSLAKTPSFSSPLFSALYERNNKKRSIFLTGSCGEVFAKSLASDVDPFVLNYSAKNVVEVKVEVHAGKEKSKSNVCFPWNDGLCITLWEVGSTYRQRSQRCPIQLMKHLIHFGVSASVAGRVMSARILAERKLQKEEEMKEMVGSRVAKRFVVSVNVKRKKGGKRRREPDDDAESSEETKIFRGQVADIQPAPNAEGEDWFLIKYDDGDSGENIAHIFACLPRYCSSIL